jgi:hypothetical protein
VKTDIAIAKLKALAAQAAFALEGEGAPRKLVEVTIDGHDVRAIQQGIEALQKELKAA